MITDEQALANKVRVQKEGRLAWSSNFQRGTLCWSTGCGKSKAAIECIEELRHEYLQNFGIGMPQGLLVCPTEQMRDKNWPDEFKEWGVSMDGVKIICYASLAKEDLSKYDYYVYDECHRITLHNLDKLALQGPKPCIGLTATYPSEKGKKDAEFNRVKMLQQLMPPVHTITTDEAVDLGLVSDFEITVVKHFIDAVNKNILAGTIRKKPTYKTEAEQYKVLSKQIGFAMMKKNEALMFGATSKRCQFLYNLPSKQRLAKAILDRLIASGKRTIVFGCSIDMIDTVCGKENVYHSESNDDAFDRFQSGESKLLGSVKALNEGVNMLNPEQALFIGIDGQERNLVQRIGRCIRFRYGNPGFKAQIFIVIAMATQDEKWYKDAIADFQTKRIKNIVVQVPAIQIP